MPLRLCVLPAEGVCLTFGRVSFFGWVSPNFGMGQPKFRLGWAQISARVIGHFSSPRLCKSWKARLVSTTFTQVSPRGGCGWLARSMNGDQSLVLGPMLWSMGVIWDQSFIIKVSRLVSWHVHLFHSNGHHLCNIWWISTKNTWFESWDDGGSTQLQIWTFLVWIWCQYSKRSRTTCALM